MPEEQFDYIIIGGGTAGCLLANRLSANPANRVLLIEAGDKDNYHWIHIPVGYLYCIGNERTDWLYNTQPAPGLNGRTLRYPRGKTLGGCSSINGMIYMRGQARDYNHWASVVDDDAWRWENCLPDFKSHECHYRLDSTTTLSEQERSNFAAFHGTGYEWRVEKQRSHWEILDAFSQAAQQSGIPSIGDFNQGMNEGVGYFEVNQKGGWRWNAAKAFLRPTTMRRPNFQLWVKTRVLGLRIERQPNNLPQCTGVKVRRGRKEITVSAHKEVILCAGSIGTPQLLQISGIGPAPLLERHGIQVIVDKPGVGCNLQDHLQIRAVFKVQGVKTLNTLASTLWGKAKIGFEYAAKRAGPMSMAPSQLGAFTRSDPSRPFPNLQYHVQPLSLETFGEPLHPFNAFTASVCNLNPQSRGKVEITSRHPDDPPAITPNYLSTEDDRKVAADSLRVTRRIVAQKALSPYSPEELKPGTQYQTGEELVKRAGDIATTIFHPVGTAKMGRASDPTAVVDTHLRVLGVAKLRVVDASIMPTITSGNTNSPTLMIAEKAARWILSGH